MCYEPNEKETIYKVFDQDGVFLYKTSGSYDEMVHNLIQVADWYGERDRDFITVRWVPASGVYHVYDKDEKLTNYFCKPFSRYMT